MTGAQKERLRELVAILRRKAARTGSMSALWDVIFDVEGLLEGKETILQMTPDEWIVYIEKHLLPVELDETES